ncbi:hypothetical protein PIB30_038488 [Stylosanthes scabra]|uniref:Uncharacterized protein n=1 Tax=Stylosanthes scabra TaxID=79078 RepID=A0ABU6REQ6_9FABA|nr:hypothetical protein [Stylosanthes scabra]
MVAFGRPSARLKQARVKAKRVDILISDLGDSEGKLHPKTGLIPKEGLVWQPTKYRSYRTCVTVRPAGSAKSCKPKANPATKMLLRLTVQRNEPVRYKRLWNDEMAEC